MYRHKDIILYYTTSSFILIINNIYANTLQEFISVTLFLLNQQLCIKSHIYNSRMRLYKDKIHSSITGMDSL